MLRSSAFPRRLPLCACLAIACALTTGISRATVPTETSGVVPHGSVDVVGNCDDAGTGSLRDTIAAAATGDTIDLTQLACSHITLTSGAIVFDQDDLTLIGPGAALLAIDGNDTSAVLQQIGYHALTLDGLTLTNGYFSDRSVAGGGCLYSRGDITLSNTVVSYCTVYDTISAYGGGVFALHSLTLDHSTITGNTARAPTIASGGALQVTGALHAYYSVVSDNTAVTANVGGYQLGGAAHTFADVVIRNSTISGNRGKIAGLFLERFNGYDNTALIVDSTISGNATLNGGPAGGVYMFLPTSIYNSTIAANEGNVAGGVLARAALVLHSTIIASASGADLVLGGGGSVDGANNLIVVADTVPADTIRADPLLAPLADNGGPTPTHALSSASPAIDTGANPLALAFDQRGDGFARESGAAPDIGAFERVAPDDVIFSNGFDPGG